MDVDRNGAAAFGVAHCTTADADYVGAGIDVGIDRATRTHMIRHDSQVR